MVYIDCRKNNEYTQEGEIDEQEDVEREGNHIEIILIDPIILKKFKKFFLQKLIWIYDGQF